MRGLKGLDHGTVRRGMRFALLCVASAVLEARPGAPPAVAQAPDSTRTSEAPPRAREPALGVQDVGIFSDLDRRLQLPLPPALDSAQIRAAIDRRRRLLVLYEGSRPIKAYPLSGSAELEVGSARLALRPGDAAELGPWLRADRLFEFETAVELPPGDADADGLPDPLDVLIGAHKAALNAARYDGRYLPLRYPGGDVPREIGVCTDVVIRALRNAGFDLQQLVHEDVQRAPRAYPMIASPNPNIDHRRVKSLLPYFERHMQRVGAGRSDAREPLLPGDIVFMDTFPNRPGSEHVGVIADGMAAPGRPFVINNWTEGTVTRAMDLLSFVPVTHRFRVPERLVDHGPVSALHTQLLTVVSESWDAARATLRRFQRAPGGAWQQVGEPIPVVLGSRGYGWGSGVHGSGPPAGRAGPLKREGDRRSPAGVFELGVLYGYAPSAPGVRLPYQQAGAALRCIDDPTSRLYNRIAPEPPGGGDFRSAEHMRRDDDLYELALVIEHNTKPVTPGHGSCIFLHVWQDANTPVTGCTALDKATLRELTRWLRPNAALLVALPAREYSALARPWGLP